MMATSGKLVTSLPHNFCSHKCFILLSTFLDTAEQLLIQRYKIIHLPLSHNNTYDACNKRRLFTYHTASSRSAYAPQKYFNLTYLSLFRGLQAFLQQIISFQTSLHVHNSHLPQVELLGRICYEQYTVLHYPIQFMQGSGKQSTTWQSMAGDLNHQLLYLVLQSTGQ